MNLTGKRRRIAASITLASLILGSPLIGVFPALAIAGEGPAGSSGTARAQISSDVTVGKPSIWSFSQAHYLLASLRERSQAIKTKDFQNGELDANATNRISLERLSSSFGVEAEFDSAVGTANRLKLQRFEESVNRVNALKSLRDQRKDEHLGVIRELTARKSKRAKLNSELPTPVPTNPSPEIQGKLNDIAKLDKQIEALEVEKEALNTEVAAINAEMTTLDTDLAKLNLTSVLSGEGNNGGGGNTSTPAPLTKAEILELITNKDSPKLNASTMIDNYIQLQYELIAKQLTLLRDEVGPNQRVIFLELPSSIYLSPKRSEGSLAQVRWRVSKYKVNDGEQKKALASRDLYGNDDEWRTVRVKEEFQTLDVIPRQSALNVAEVHNTVNGFNLGAKFVWLFGFGAKVSYQRQREMYDQFLYQEIFASGFGKGEQDFGWTFGPLPGTTRIAPGMRTTYAVLSVPRNASAIELEGLGFSFPRKEEPTRYINEERWQKFRLVIPREADGFALNKIDYVPVRAGENLTAVLRGDYFSPQVGILVNGVPLKRVLAIAQSKAQPKAAKDVEGAEQPPPPPAGASSPGASPIEGEFEYVSSDTLILRWSMPSGYEGTPIITLVTPQSTSSINDEPLTIRGREPKTTLANLSSTEPMFFQPLDAISLEVLNNANSVDNVVTAKIKGRGFKPRAEISVNNVLVANPEHLSTSEYNIRFTTPTNRHWHISIVQKMDQGPEADNLDYEPSDSSVTYEILDYKSAARGAFARKANLDVLFTLGNKADINQFSIEAVTNNPVKVATGAPHDTGLNYRIETIDNPLRLKVIRGTRIVRYINLHWPEPPTILKIINESEGLKGKAEGKTDGGYRVRIKGSNFLQVTQVKFGRLPVTSIEARSDDTIIVVVPASEAGRVFVTLTTAIVFNENFVTNIKDFDDSDERAFFTYLSPPPVQPSP